MSQWNRYMAAMINLPIFLEQGVGLSTAFIGSLIFVRPGFGSIMSILIGRVMGRPEHCLTNLRIVRLGAVVALLAYICLALAAELIVAADGNPALQGALTVGCLLLQASGSFGAFLVFPSTCAHANQNDVSKFQSCMVVNCGLMLRRCLGVFLGGNAIVLERVPEDNLSNVRATLTHSTPAIHNSCMRSIRHLKNTYCFCCGLRTCNIARVTSLSTA